MYALIPCMCCHVQYPPKMASYVCDKCNYRVCPACLHKHTGPYAGGSKCSQCAWGYMKRHN